MPKTDAYEADLLAAFDKGALKSVATKAELSRFKAAARATAPSASDTGPGAPHRRRTAGIRRRPR